MKRAILALLLCLILISPMSAGAASTHRKPARKLKVLVLIVPSPKFRMKYKYSGSTYTSRDDSGSDSEKPERFQLQETLIEKLQKKLDEREKGGVWEPVFCKTSSELGKKASDTAAYLSMTVVILEKRRTYKKRVIYELVANCEVQRKSQAGWARVFSRKLTSTSSDRKKEEYYVSETDRMAEYLDDIIIDRMVPYEIVNAVARDTRTKIINAVVMNTTPFPISSIKWTVPLEKDKLNVNTEVGIRPGEKKRVTIAVTARRAHASLQWRKAVIAGIKFSVAGL